MVYIVNNKLKTLHGMLPLDHCVQRNVDSQIKNDANDALKVDSKTTEQLLN